MNAPETPASSGTTPIEDFIEFYLSPDHSSKTIQLTQLKVRKKTGAITDKLLQSTAAITKALRELRHLKKLNHRAQVFADTSLEKKLYDEVTDLDPADCLILLSKTRYHLNDETLSLVLKSSEDHIEFRRQQLLAQLKDEGLPVQLLGSMSPPIALPAPQTTPQKTTRSLPLAVILKRLPFPARFALETGSVLLILVFLLWIIPEIRNQYENSIQKRINDYLIEASLVDSPAPAGTSKEPKIIVPAIEGEKNKLNSSSEISDSAEESVNSANKKQPRVNDGETWRFSFTGSLTNDIETGIDSLLKKYTVDQSKPITVPGGIQFDFVLPSSSLISLKSSLEEMASQLQKRAMSTSSNIDAASARQASLSAVNMSWYKKRNMGTRKIPNSHVLVIIWISTL